MPLTVGDLMSRVPLANWSAAVSGVDLWLLDLDRTEPNWALLDQDQIARARRFHFARDRHRFAARHSWLRQLLGQYLGCPAAAVRLARTREGKPQVAWPRTADRPLQFNLSSAEGLGLCALRRGGRVGVDLERIRPLAWEAIAARVFTPAEQDLLGRLPMPARTRCFFQLWTAHEALVKADGCGLGGPVLALDCARLATDHQTRLQDFAGTHWDCLSLVPRAGWVGTLVVESS